MQRIVSSVLLLVAAAPLVFSLKFVENRRESPVTQVVKLLTDLKAGIEADGKAEQTSYDKYACWCEDTLSEKATAITKAKELIEELQTKIIQLTAEIATHEAEIKQTEKEIAANIESQREATEVREKESRTYDEEKSESEQCIGALESAIKVLMGAGNKKGFLETMQQAQLLSVVAGVRGLLAKPAARAMKQEDLVVVRHFVESPEDFVGAGSNMLSAAQIAHNPFGDYAPQSTQIQGILKSMYDSFASDLEKSNGEEGTKQKSFEELMATKRAELETLKDTLQSHTKDYATKTKDLADSKSTLDDTKEQLEADEIFFGETKTTCKQRANEWAQRSKLRTEELAGVDEAVKVLSSDDAKKTFDSAATTFLQVSSRARHFGNTQRAIAYNQLTSVARKTRSLRLAKIAVVLQAGGHFDQVIAMIDNMIALCRDEEQKDIDDRNFCQANQNKNKNDMEDLEHSIKKAKTQIERVKGEITDLEVKITELEQTIKATNSSMVELKDMRTKEREDFLKAVKDDTDAVALLEQAIVHLSKFYDNKGVKLSLVQGGKKAEPRPELSWAPEKDGGDYKGREGEHQGIVGILEMIKEDVQKEISTGRVEDGEAQVNYEKDSAALLATMRAQEKSKAQAEMEKAELGRKVTDYEHFIELKNKDLGAEKENEVAIGTKCAWLESHFEERRTQRKAELDGLVDAKAYLAGVDSGDDI